MIARIKGIQRNFALHHRSDLIKLDRKLRKELEIILHQEELIWFQRSREEWITSGDCNTSFYHTSTTIRKNTAKIQSLRTKDGLWITDERLFVDHIRNFFMSLYEDGHQPAASDILNEQFLSLTEQEWLQVSQPFKLEEIKLAVFEMNPCKALGYDGYTAGFY
ncbi:uncharacterized protein LOC116029690 [Ipomoea triloba]|uniref:uncharacterized protein LOC116029690 n=1 Tax=Ipomoea triloba TaxID=35885 RepID=UPI00125E12F2|nr:uncharacterized protein LOC116029690 [Ipomoea triloba]